ncbi:MAG: tandem-95 repeat protein, partial [Flavobacteriales bacterium]|nr:tandem-95 repeat protein [Flavobacteriales bacterium]
MKSLLMLWLLLITGTFVHAQNQAPIAGDDEAVTQEDNAVSGDLSENDTDPNGDALTYSLVTGTPDGSIVINADGTYTYTPNTNAYGIEYLYYQVCDPDGLCDTGELLIAVFFVNDPPVLADDMLTAPQGQTVSIDLGDNDLDLDDEPIDYIVLSNPSHGSFTLNINGTFSYTPTPGYTGPDDVIVMGCDPCEACDISNIIINVTPPNGPPVTGDDYIYLDEDASTMGDLTGNDSDPDGDVLTYTLLAPPASGTLVVNPDGTFTFTPAANFNGNLTAWYQACDQTGHCDQAMLIIEVGEVNDAPQTVNDTYTVNEDGILTGNVLTNDLELENETLECGVMSQPTHGTLSLSPNGNFTYTPTANYVGTDSFTYVALDPFGEQGIGLVSITVVNVNETPIANNETKYLNEDATATGNVSTNDSDPDGDVLTYTVLDGANNGTFVLNANGTYTYTPNNNFAGLDFVVYNACDPGGLCDNAT